MDRRKNYLSLILLDALEDEKESDINFILENNSKAIDPSYAPLERGITPLHYVCGMENIQLATEVAKRFLDMQADPNCLCDENLTPLHVAAVHGRQNIVRLLLQYGADLDVYDSNQKTPALYAIEECHFEVLQIMKDHIFLKKYEKRKATNLTVLTESRFENSLQQTVLNNKETLSSTPNCTSNANENRKAVKNKNLLKVTNSLDDSFSNGAENKFTPNRIHYNYDVTSPYYINITHRRHNPQPKFPKQHPESIERNINAGVNNSIKDIASISAQNKEFSSTDGVEAVNIFSLTMQNLTELTERTSVCEKSRFSLIQSWRDKVQKSSARQAVIKQFDNVVDMIDQLVENDNLNFTNVELNEKSPIKKTQQQSDTEADSEVCASAESIMLSAFKNTTVRKKYAKDKSVPSSQINLSQLMQNVIQAKIQDFESDRPKMNETYCLQRNTDLESSYRTAPENIACHNDQEPQDHPNTSNFIRSPKNNEYFLQMTEAYVHTDDENGLVFYETKLLSNTANAHAIQRNRSPTHDRDGDTTMNSQSINLPLDYATDTLRAELTAFGEPPGPITKTTKKLYIKKLIKYKRNITNNRELCENKKQTNTVTIKLVMAFVHGTFDKQRKKIIANCGLK